jgi:hypothetical protein
LWQEMRARGQYENTLKDGQFKLAR